MMAKEVMENVRLNGYATQEDVYEVGQLYLKGQATAYELISVVDRCEAIYNKDRFIDGVANKKRKLCC